MVFSKVLKESFGSYLRLLRESKEIPIRKLAAFLDIDQSTLSKFERGERLPKIELLPKIADFFQVDLSEIKLAYLSEKVLVPILTYENAEEVLDMAKEKLKYAKSKNYDQGKLNFNGI